MNTLLTLSQKVGEHLVKNKLLLATAESCTGGQVAEIITAIPGSSHWFDCAFVTYSNNAKIKMLSVKKSTIDTFGAVSKETVSEMVQGALQNSNADIAVAITGIAGPDGGTDEKPLGTVWIAWQKKNAEIIAEKFLFSGDRLAIRCAATEKALEKILAI